MSKTQEALKLALEALEESLGYVEDEAETAQRLYGQYPTRKARIQGLKDDARKHMDAITAIRARLEQPEQEPVAKKDVLSAVERHGLAEQQYPDNFIDALMYDVARRDSEALAEKTAQQQEPVANLTVEDGRVAVAAKILPDGVYDLYTSPPASKPWVGLTDEEKSDLWCESTGRDCVNEDTHVFADAIEAKLREKNA